MAWLLTYLKGHHAVSQFTVLHQLQFFVVAGHTSEAEARMRMVEDIRASLNRAPNALSTKRYLLELVEVILFRMNTQGELGPWELDQLSKALGYLRLNIGGSETHFSTSWLSAAEASIVKSLVPHDSKEGEKNAHPSQLKHVSYDQLMAEIQSLRDLLPSGT